MNLLADATSEPIHPVYGKAVPATLTLVPDTEGARCSTTNDCPVGFQCPSGGGICVCHDSGALCGTLGPPMGTNTGAGASALVSADFTNDGIADLAVANKGDNTVTILRGIGDGTYFNSGNLTVTAPVALATGDFDHDGKIDLVAAGNMLTVFMNGATTPTGFMPGPALSAGAPSGVAVADLNGDGKLDLAVSDSSGNAIAFFNDGHTPFIGNSVAYAVGGNPRAIAVSDVDRDGKIDLVLANSFGNQNIDVLINNGNGTFKHVATYGGGLGARAIAISDLNIDGKPDLIIANERANSVSVLLGTGTGAFPSVVDYPVPAAPQALIAVDLDSDGRVDIATVSASPGKNLNLLQGRGDGRLQAAGSYAAGASLSSLVAGDFNRDGQVDLAVTDVHQANVLLNLAKPLATIAFANPTSYQIPKTPEQTLAGDFNRDGKIDLVTVGRDENKVTLLLNKGDGTFTAVDLPTGNRAEGVAVADFNRDGILDLAICGYNGSRPLEVLMGDGTGAFPSSTPYTGLVGCYGIDTADFNLDGAPDLAVVDAGASKLFILYNAGDGSFNLAGAPSFSYSGSYAGATAADFDNNGKADVLLTSASMNVTLFWNDGAAFTQTTVFVGYQQAVNCVADFNRDGKLDFASATHDFAGSMVFLNNGDRTFKGMPIAGVGPSPVDVNRDGRLDMMVGSDSGFAVLLGDGAGGFSTAGTFATGFGASGGWGIDVNGDTLPDFIADNYYGTNLNVILNTSH